MVKLHRRGHRPAASKTVSPQGRRKRAAGASPASLPPGPVSYTHLDVYKRQAPRSAEQVKRRATPPRHGPTLSTTARAASSPPPCRLYSTTAAEENQRPGVAVQKNFPRRGNPQPPKKIAKKCLTKRHATVYAESTERHATVNRPTSRKGKTP